jgi:protein required for attachment to host cells
LRLWRRHRAIATLPACAPLAAGDYSDPVLVAPPKTLGRLGKTIHAEVEKRMVGEIGKDVTDRPVSEIEETPAALDWVGARLDWR